MQCNFTTVKPYLMFEEKKKWTLFFFFFTFWWTVQFTSFSFHLGIGDSWILENIDVEHKAAVILALINHMKMWLIHSFQPQVQATHMYGFLKEWLGMKRKVSAERNTQTWPVWGMRLSFSRYCASHRALMYG